MWLYLDNNLFTQKQVVGWIWPMNYNLLTPANPYHTYSRVINVVSIAHLYLKAFKCFILSIIRPKFFCMVLRSFFIWLLSPSSISSFPVLPHALYWINQTVCNFFNVPCSLGLCALKDLHSLRQPWPQNLTVVLLLFVHVWLLNYSVSPLGE